MSGDRNDSWERALRAAMMPARELELTDAEVRRAFAAYRARPVRGRATALRIAVAACGAIAVLAGGGYAVPATRAAVGDLFGSVSDWVAGDDGAAPGRPLLAADDAPAWVSETDGERRLVAEHGGVKVYAIRDGDELTIGVGDSYAETATIDGWRRQLADHRVTLLGTGTFPSSTPGGVPLDARKRRPIFGLTSKAVVRVDLRYTAGAPTTATGLDGGYVILADAYRRPASLVGYDAAGRQVDRIDVSGLQLRVCREVRGCPPGAYDPPVARG